MAVLGFRSHVQPVTFYKLYCFLKQEITQSLILKVNYVDLPKFRLQISRPQTGGENPSTMDNVSHVKSYNMTHPRDLLANNISNICLDELHLNLERELI